MGVWLTVTLATASCQLRPVVTVLVLFLWYDLDLKIGKLELILGDEGL